MIYRRFGKRALDFAVALARHFQVPIVYAWAEEIARGRKIFPEATAEMAAVSSCMAHLARGRRKGEEGVSLLIEKLTLSSSFSSSLLSVGARGDMKCEGGGKEYSPCLSTVES